MNDQLHFFDRFGEDLLVRQEETVRQGQESSGKSGGKSPGPARSVVKPLPGPSATAGERNRDRAYRMAEPRLGTSRARVLECIRSAGRRGVTREEISRSTGMKVSSVCGRVSELLSTRDRDGRPIQPLIRSDGTKRRGPSPDSEDQVVLFDVDLFQV